MAPTGVHPLERLPVEVLANILQLLDIDSYPSAVLSFQTMHKAHEEFPLSISVILRRMMPRDVAPWAMAALVTSPAGRSIAPWEAAVDALARGPPALLPLYESLRWRQVLALGRLHRAVERLADDLVERSLSSLLGAAGRGPRPPRPGRVAAELRRTSGPETFRVQRALYAVEILSNILPAAAAEESDGSESEEEEGEEEEEDGDAPVDPAERRREEFLGKRAARLVRSMAPWVIEQVDWAYGFLVTKVTRIIDLEERYNRGLAESHRGTVSTFSANMRLLDRRETIVNARDAFMRRGLLEIYLLCTASSREERASRVRAIYQGEDGSAAVITVETALWCYHCPAAGGHQPGASLSAYPAEELERLRASRDGQDGEHGPFHTWFWLYKDSAVHDELPRHGAWRGSFEGSWTNEGWRSLQTTGHVFWDKSRPGLPSSVLLAYYRMALRRTHVGYDAAVDSDEASETALVPR